GYSKGVATTEGRRAAECTIVAEEGSSGVERETAAGNSCSEGSLLAVNKEDGNERSLLAALVWQEIAAGRDQDRWQRKIAAGSVSHSLSSIRVSKASNLALISSSNAMAYNSRSVILRSFCYRVKGMYWLDDLVAERDGGPKVKGCSLDLVSSYDGSATEGDDGGVGDKVSNYRNCLDDGGQLEVQRGTKITTLIPKCHDLGLMG
ncbi:hypothetical protein BHM03_00053379, partial [Ensete ventricosum]